MQAELRKGVTWISCRASWSACLSLSRRGLMRAGAMSCAMMLFLVIALSCAVWW